MDALADVLHRRHAALALGQLLDHRSGRALGNVDHHVLHGLADAPVDLAQDDLGARDGELVALATHGLDQHRDLELAAPGHRE
jgi:hypothetical protein